MNISGSSRKRKGSQVGVGQGKRPPVNPPLCLK